jgi:hypothetical protein
LLQRLLRGDRQVLRQLPQFRIAQRHQLPEQRGRARGREVRRLEQEVVAVVVAFPERPSANGQCPQRGVDDQVGEPIHVEAVSPLPRPPGVLVGGVADLARALPGQRRHEHAIVIDQLDGQCRGFTSRHEQYVPVLQITVGEVRCAEKPGQPNPGLSQLLQDVRLVQMLLEKVVQRQPFHPIHLQDRIPPTVNTNALVQVLERDHERQSQLPQIGTNLHVPRAESRDFAGEAFHCPGPSSVPNLVDVGKVAGTGDGQSEGVDRGVALPQIGIAETDAGMLKRLIVILRERPRHRQSSALTGR